MNVNLIWLWSLHQDLFLVMGWGRTLTHFYSNGSMTTIGTFYLQKCSSLQQSFIVISIE
jgi:hypothetical protein